MYNTNFDDVETRHRYCPKNIDSWCKYQKDILTGEKTYKDHVNLPVAIKKEMFGRSNTKQQQIVKCSYLEEMPKGFVC